MTDEDVERVREHPLLRAVDESQFPKNLSLHEIIRNDGRLQYYRHGDFVMRRGEYGNAAFLIMLGRVRVLYDEERLGAVSDDQATPKRSVIGALSQLWRRNRLPEVRQFASYRDQGDVGLRQRGDDTPRTFIKDVDALSDVSIVRSAGEVIGEIAALSRTPRSASVVADGEAVLFELRWQGLRDIRRYDANFRQQIDALYRERGLVAHLAESPLLRHFDKATLDAIATQTLFETYGEFEWFRGFKAEAEASEAGFDRAAVIVEEGQYLDGLIMLRSGFGRLSRRLDHGHRTVGYLVRNETFGLSEIVRHLQRGTELVAPETLSALGYVDVLRMPTHLVEQHILPNLSKGDLAGLLEDPPEPAPAWVAAPKGGVLEQSLINFLVDGRYINGTATMVIDTNRCVHCDECVRACAVAHDNNPRFIRHGVTHLNLMVANACMHCVDPVCLIGCPTGAIHRKPQDGRVVIDDQTCIGCGTCANSCPYNNIRMVEIRDQTGAIMIDEETRNPIVKATKCDLCEGQLGGPACQRACPHDALLRVDMRERDAFARWTQR